MIRVISLQDVVFLSIRYNRDRIKAWPEDNMFLSATDEYKSIFEDQVHLIIFIQEYQVLESTFIGEITNRTYDNKVGATRVIERGIFFVDIINFMLIFNIKMKDIC